MHTIIPSFNAGEVSPRIHSRVDLDKYGSSCKTLENFIIMPYGGVNRRPGMEYMGAAGDSATASRLIAFNFSITTNFVLEFGDETIRFWSNGEQVLLGGSAYELASPYPSSSLFEIQYCQINDVMYLVHPDYPIYKLSRYADANWTLEETEWTNPPFRTENTTDETMTLSAVTGTGVTLTCSAIVFSPDHVGSYWRIGHKRALASKRINFSGNGSTAALRVQGDWEFTTFGTWAADVEIQRTYDLTAPPASTSWETIRSWDTSGGGRNITATGSEMEECQLRIRVTNRASGGTNDGAVIEAVESTVYGIVKVTALPASSTKTITGVSITGTANNERLDFSCASHGFSAGDIVTISGVVSSGNLADYANRELTISSIISSNSFRVEFPDTDLTGTYTSGGSALKEKYASCTVDVVIDAYDTTATAVWAEGAWSDYRGYPRTVCLHEQRLWFGGNSAQSQTLWASGVDDFENFRLGTFDDQSIEFTLASAEQNSISWMVSQQALCVGTNGDEYIIDAGESGTIINATSIRVRRQSRYGSKYLQAILINEVALFAQRQGKKLREFVYSFDKDGYVAPDLTLLAEHVARSGIKQIAFQQQPDAILWCVTEDGQLIGMTYERDQKVVGWHRHSTDGTVESVACIYGDDDADEVWLVVNRTINGNTVRYIERMDPSYRSTLDDEDSDNWFYVDSGLILTPSGTTVSGLSHLEGETVSVLLDGATHPDCVVTSGAITLDYTGTTAVVGLPYTSTLEPLPLEITMNDGTAQGRKMRVHRCAVRVYKSAGGEMFVGGSEWDTICTRSMEDDMNEPVPILTGEREIVVASGYNAGTEIIVRQNTPQPLTVLSLIPIYDAYGE